MKRLLLAMLFPMLVMGQIQIGGDIDGDSFQDAFGFSTSISGDGSLIVIGAPNNESNGILSGQMKVFSIENGNWIQVGEGISGETIYDMFGFSVSISENGNVIAVGSRDGANEFENDTGYVRTFIINENSLVQLGQTISGDDSGDLFGTSISLSSNGNYLAIGAPSASSNSGNTNGNGLTRVFELQNGVWLQVGEDITGGASSDSNGSSVALSSDGNIIAVGAIGADAQNDEFNNGSVEVYSNNNGVWEQIGNTIYGEFAQDLFGFRVSLSADGNTVLGTSIRNSQNGNFSGHARVFENQNNSWVQIGEDIDGDTSGVLFGSSADINSSGNVIAVGARSQDSNNGGGSGKTRIYRNENGSWIQVGNDINGENANDQAGYSLSLSSTGEQIVIGARNASTNELSQTGHVRVYDLSAILSTPENNITTFTIYPNPTKTQFNVQLSDGETLEKVNIYNNLGQLIKSTTQITIDTSDLSSGVYFVSVETTAGKGVQKLIIE